MKKARLTRLLRVFYASSSALGVAVACTVADKGDYEFTDEEPGGGGETNGGTGGASGSSGAKGGTSGSGGSRGGASGGGGETAGDGGEAGAGATSGTGGQGGEGGETGGTSGKGGSSGSSGKGGSSGSSGKGGSSGAGGKCGDNTVDPGEDCDDGNRVDEPCPYFATACTGCSSTCRHIRPPSCGDNVKNGANPTSLSIQYLATVCLGIDPYVPLYLNGVLIPNVPWGTPCSCTPGVQVVTVTDPTVLGALRQNSNILSLVAQDTFLAWAVVTVVFDNGARIEKVGYDFGAPGDAEARNPGIDMCDVPTFFGSGNSDGMPFGGFPVEQCDGTTDCYNCSLPQCITVTNGVPVALTDYDVTNGMPGGGQSFVTIPQLGTIRDVDVTLDISHTFDGDLGISLSGPSNQTVSLVERRGSNGQNFQSTTLDSACTTPIAAGSAPFTGCFQPETPLDLYNGFPSSIGPWFLSIRDNAAGDTGTLNTWSLKVCGVP